MIAIYPPTKDTTKEIAIIGNRVDDIKGSLALKIKFFHFFNYQNDINSDKSTSLKRNCSKTNGLRRDYSILIKFAFDHI